MWGRAREVGGGAGVAGSGELQPSLEARHGCAGQRGGGVVKGAEGGGGVGEGEGGREGGRGEGPAPPVSGQSL